MRKKKGAVKKKARNDTSTKAKIVKKRKIRRTKTPRTRNGGTMTEAEFFQKIRNALRKAFRFWVPMVQSLEKAKRPSQSTNKALKWEYQCNICKNWYPRTGVEIDHIIPCGQLNKLEDIPQFIENLVPEDSSAFQVICKADHLEKTLLEKATRKLNKEL